MNTKIELYLNDIKEYVNSALIYMQDEKKKNIDKKRNNNVLILCR